MIRFEHVSMQYSSGTFALHDISFTIEQGQFVFLIGPSGAGKTSLLRLIMRQLLPDEGSVFVEDEEISAQNFKSSDELRKKIGTVFQDFKIIQDRNALENVMVGLEIMHYKSPKEEAMNALTLAGIEKKAGFFPLQLSAGEQQRLAIARAIAGGRQLILADEPTGNVDPVTMWEIVHLFRKIHDDKRTIIFATHNAEIVNALKQRVITVKKGKIVKDKQKGSYSLDL